MTETAVNLSAVRSDEQSALMRNSANLSSSLPNQHVEEAHAPAVEVDEKERELFEKLFESQKDIFCKIIQHRMQRAG